MLIKYNSVNQCVNGKRGILGENKKNEKKDEQQNNSVYRKIVAMNDGVNWK